jgi:S1-C subfamily serine protease
MAARPLAQDEQWAGIVYTENARKSAVTDWGASCGVSENNLLTNYHVVKNAPLILVGGWSDTSRLVHAEVVHASEKDDLALLKVDPPDKLGYINAFEPTDAILEGEEVLVWAYLQVPDGFMQFLRRGMVSNNTPLPGYERTLYIETSAVFGTSGSPVFTRTGKLLGIVSMTLKLPGGLPLPAGVLGVIRSETVNQFLKDAKVSGY